MAVVFIAVGYAASGGKSNYERFREEAREEYGPTTWPGVDGRYVEFCTANSASAMNFLGQISNHGVGDPRPFEEVYTDVARVQTAPFGANAMAEAAPDEIKSEMELLAAKLNELVDNPSQPFDVDQELRDAYSTVDTFIAENCFPPEGSTAVP